MLPGQGGECVGLAQVVGQCGKLKPSGDAPIRGLYDADADDGAAGMGTLPASQSGTEVARRVVHERNRRHEMQ